MKKNFSYFVIIFTIFFCLSLFSAQLVITQSGQYGIGAPIAYTPTGSDAIIRIAASNVILDVGNNVLQQSGGSGTLNGIEISAGFSNITIQNAIIKNVSGAGILVNQNCSNLILSNIQTLTTNQGIVLNSSANNAINTCRIANSFINFAAQDGIFVGPQTSDIIIDSVVLDSCSSTTFAISFAGAVNNRNANNTISNCMLTRCGSGIQLLHTDNTVVRDCNIINSVITGASFVGFFVFGASTNQSKGNIVENCAVLDASASGRAATGFAFQQSTKSVVKDCIVKMEGSSAASATGFYLFGSSNNISLENCSVPRLTCVNQSIGFRISGCQDIVIKNSEALSIQKTGATVGTTDGFRIESSNIITVDDCVSSGCRDSGYRTSNSAGVVVRTSISSGNTFNSFVSTGNVRTIYDSCITNSTLGDGFSISDNNTLLNNCKSVAVSQRGFGFNNTSSNCIVQYSVALQCGGTTIGGFQNASGATATVFNNNVATNCGVGFRELNAAIGTNRYFLNKATNNTTNYSGPIPSQNSAGTNATQGGNLSI